jgi:hypothetical protein
MIEIPQRAALLSRTHLFNGLNEEQLNAVASELEEAAFKAGEEIVAQGQQGDQFYLIVKGKVRVTRKDSPKPLAVLVEGDYFGEEAMLVRDHRRTATVTAVDDTYTLVLKREHFQNLLKQTKNLRANFLVAVNSRRLSRRIRFKWLPEDEVIYYLARKHPILLIRALIVPALLTLLGIAGLLFAWYKAEEPAMQALWWVALLVTILAGLWALWNGIDWGNDYYILTNRRVVWLEKVVGIYDSRNEAPLSAVQRVNVQTEFWGRQLEYGNLVVRTIVGSSLTLQNISYPYQAAALIEEHWKRSLETTRKMEEEEMRQALRERLLKGTSRPIQLPSLIAKPQAKPDPYKGKRGFANLFRLRFEDKAIVTYRKHIVVLLRQTWKPFLLLLALVAALIFALTRHLLSEAPTLELESLLCVWGLLFGVAFFWWLYQYIDWSNDIFQVTPEQILDIDKTPLGEMTSDIAALDNILSIEYARRGLWELLFNYGNVMITIGGGKQMIFEDVANPSAVQDDIERRRLERIAKREQEKARAERERIADWFAAYYHNEQSLRSEELAQKPPEPGQEDGDSGGS